jgi:hypothetical protein
MADTPANGTVRDIDGKPCIFYDGYWIRRYKTDNSLAGKAVLIDQLTKRVFHHTEPGINTPGNRLEEAKAAYERETNPARKRVAGAMLAGAYLNRASDIFTKLVELQQAGVKIDRQNALMHQCGECYMKALELGKLVKHYSGEEGLDELWGEPLKAFTMPVDAFYETRYVKIAQTMADIDRITSKLIETVCWIKGLEGLETLLREFAETAKCETETLRSDPVIFDVWPQFVCAGETIAAFSPDLPPDLPETARLRVHSALQLVDDGRALLTYIASARVPMPKSTRHFLERCERFRREQQQRIAAA